MEDGRWKMEDGRWKIEVGSWKLEVGSWAWGYSTCFKGNDEVWILLIVEQLLLLVVMECAGRFGIRKSRQEEPPRL